MRFRRKRTDEPDVSASTEGDDPADPDAQEGLRATGPWDASEVTLDEDNGGRVDLGSLLVTPREGLEVQLQVDEASGVVIAAMLVGGEGAAELRAFAAPRNGDIWDDVRRRLTGEVAQLGGTATESDGPYGAELVVSLTVELPDGTRTQQLSRVVGIAGPRWLLRVTFYGRPAVEYDESGDVEQAVRDVVVVRGGTPVPPGDILPLTMPSDARRSGPPTV